MSILVSPGGQSRLAMGCLISCLVSESGLGWGGQPRAPSEVPGGKILPLPQLWERYSGDRHI